MNSQRLYQWLCERLQRQPDHSDWPLGDLESQRAQLRPCDVLLVDGDSPLDRRLKVLTGSRFSRVLLYIGRPHEVAITCPAGRTPSWCWTPAWSADSAFAT